MLGRDVTLFLLVALPFSRSFGIFQRKGRWTGRPGFVPTAALRSPEYKSSAFRSGRHLVLGCHASNEITGYLRDPTRSSATEHKGDSDNSANLTRRTLYPQLFSNRNGTLQVDSLHTLYYEEYGRDPANESQINVQLPPLRTSLFLHGGPGAGCFPNHARFFDPAHYRIILFDQRGCGRSSPRGETRNNTLSDLVRDCEALRKKLGISKWDCVLGGSWGVTLALAYAQHFPSRVASLVLRGICTLRSQEVNWLFARDGGAAVLNPAGWDEFEQAIGLGSGEMLRDKATPVNNLEWRRAVLHAYYDCFLGEDPLVRLHAAKGWFKWEMSVAALAGFSENKDKAGSEVCLLYENGMGWKFLNENGDYIALNSEGQSAHDCVSSLRRWQLPANQSSNQDTGTSSSIRIPRPCYPIRRLLNLTLLNCTEEAAAQFVPSQAMLTCYYSVNDRNMMQNFDLLSKENIHRIRHIPCIAVQGGQDTICPPDTALDLHRVWPEMKVRIPLASGHSMYDPAITSELVKATELMIKVGK